MNARLALKVVTMLAMGGLSHTAMASSALPQADLPISSQLAPTQLTATTLGSVGGEPSIVVTASAFDAKANVSKGFSLIRSGRQEQAVALFDQVIRKAQAHLGSDTRLRLCGEAGDTVAGAVSVDPAICDAHFGKGFALIDLGRGDLAEADLRQATQMAPDNAHFANEYAELFKSRRAWPQSFAAFAKAWEIVDKSTTGPDAKVAARALRGMGFAKSQMGEFDAAKRYLEQSLEYDANNSVARVELGQLAKRQLIGS